MRLACVPSHCRGLGPCKICEHCVLPGCHRLLAARCHPAWPCSDQGLLAFRCSHCLMRGLLGRFWVFQKDPFIPRPLEPVNVSLGVKSLQNQDVVRVKPGSSHMAGQELCMQGARQRQASFPIVGLRFLTMSRARAWGERGSRAPHEKPLVSLSGGGDEAQCMEPSPRIPPPASGWRPPALCRRPLLLTYLLGLPLALRTVAVLFQVAQEAQSSGGTPAPAPQVLPQGLHSALAVPSAGCCHFKGPGFLFL